MNDVELQDISQVKIHLRRIIESELAISLKNVSDVDELSKLNVDTDDWSFSVIPAIEKYFSLKESPDDWSKVGSIDEIANFIIND